MNFDKLYAWVLSAVIAAAAADQLPKLQTWIWRAQARVLFESRTSTWGSPRFFTTTEHIESARKAPVRAATR